MAFDIQPSNEFIPVALRGTLFVQLQIDGNKNYIGIHQIIMASCQRYCQVKP